MNRSILPCRFLSTRSFPIRIAAAVAVLLPVLSSLRAAPPDAPPADTTIITALTPRQARELAGLKTRSLVLDGVTDLDADTAAAIAAFPGVALHLNGLRSLDPNTAAALATFPGLRLQLDGLKELDTETAAALARFVGASLHLDGLERLDADAATALAACPCLRLHVGRIAGRTALDMPDAPALVRLHATALATTDGRVAFPKLAKLSPGAAAAVVAIDSWDGNLPGITAFEAVDSVAVAAALATRKGRLSLPNLKKISPKTLSALIEKEDVQIPRIDMLELIPEPDGSPTDDFVVPERFQERQDRQDR